MTSMSSMLANYTDLKEVSATLDKLKENALKTVRSIHDFRDCEYNRKDDKNVEFAIDSNIHNICTTNQKTTRSKEDTYFDEYDNQNENAYDLFKNEMPNKSKDLNDVFEYDFVNMDGCFYNEYQQLHEGPYTKQDKRSYHDQLEKPRNIHEESLEHNIHVMDAKITNDLNESDDIYAHEDNRNSNEQLFELVHSNSDVKWNLKDLGKDQNCSMSNEEQNNLHPKKLATQGDCKDVTFKPINDVTNQEINHDLNYRSSLYKYASTQKAGSVGHYSNESSDKESCNSEMNGEPMQKEDASLQNSYGHMHNDMKDIDVDDENHKGYIERYKEETSFGNDALFTYEDLNVCDNKSVGNNCEDNSNVDLQKMNKSSYNNIVQKSSNEHYDFEQRNIKFIQDGRQNEPHYEQNYQISSNMKANEYNHRHHGNPERSNFRATNMHPYAYNKIHNRFVKRRFEDFRGRRRFNDRDMSLHMRESRFQDCKRYPYRSTAPRQYMLAKRTSFNENKYNMAHTRHGNELHDSRDSRKRNRFSQGINSFHDVKAKESFKNVSQQSSSSAHREDPQTYYSRKRSRRSISLESDEDDKTSHKDKPSSDIEKSPQKSPAPGFSDCRNRRFCIGSSGLGGYSPRRRRSETAIKTPSPPSRSPDRRKTRAWDMVPVGIDSKVVAAIAAAHTAQQVVAKQVSTLSSISPLVSMNILNPTNNLNVVSNPNLSTIIPSILHQVNPPFTTVTLTQATRSIRRLYVGNVPSTVSDGELMEFMNAAMLSANANHIPGTKPCINCIVNIEKAYAFAEFITPEDATTALGFDGVTLHGTILKIRRPKDFIAPEHGGCPIAQPMINLVADIVLDSPHKIFVGGISSLLTPDKVKEIITAFGQLKSFHWKPMNYKGCSMAFLEYLDPTVTSQACVGLNGMHLDGQVLTVLQATPNAIYEVFSKNPPFYDVPHNALPLIETPTNIIKLFNLVNEEEVCNMEDNEVKELMEDVRFECRRFGNIRSMQFVKPPTLSIPTISNICDNTKNEKVCHSTESNDDSLNDENKNNVSSLEIINKLYGLKDNMDVLLLNEDKELHNIEDSSKEQVLNTSALISFKDNCIHDCKKEDTSLEADCEDNCKKEIPSFEGDCEYDFEEKKTLLESDCEHSCNEETLMLEVDYEHGDNHENLSLVIDCKDEKVSSKTINIGDHCKQEKELLEVDHEHGCKQEKILLEGDCEGDCKQGKQTIEESTQPLPTLNSLLPNNSIINMNEFEPLKMGHIYVEYSREESACQAVHALNGRTFGQQKVEVVFISPRIYFKYFGKGLGLQSLEEKQTLSLAIQKHLTTHIKD